MRQWLQDRGCGSLDLILWSVSLSAWLPIIAIDRLSATLPALCGGRSAGTIAWSADRLDLAIHAIDGPSLALGAALMIVAMMTPTLFGPLLHLWDRSLARHRWRAIALFATGYLATWTLACALLTATALVLSALTGSVLVAGCVAGCGALAWQISPARARCLARCHRPPRLSIFGAAALADPLLYGLTQAVWCAATCWALMLLPLCVSVAHLPLMAAVTLLVAIERIVPRRPVRSSLLDRAAARIGRRLMARDRSSPGIGTRTE